MMLINMDTYFTYCIELHVPEVEYPGVKNFFTSTFFTFSSPEPKSEKKKTYI